jgi:hypothetical protein
LCERTQEEHLLAEDKSTRQFLPRDLHDEQGISIATQEGENLILRACEAEEFLDLETLGAIMEKKGRKKRKYSNQLNQDHMHLLYLKKQPPTGYQKISE